MRDKLLRFFALTALIAFSLAACSGGSGGSGSKGRLRFVNTIAELSTVFVFINEDTAPLELSYGEISEYQKYDDGEAVEVRLLVPSSPLPLLEKNVSIRSGRDQTLVFFSDKKANKLTDYDVGSELLSDESEPSVDSRFLLRIVNAAPSVKGVDLFVTDPGADLDNVLPYEPNIGFQSSSGYVEGNVSSGVISLVDSKSRELIYESELINFDATPVITLIVMDQEGRGLPVVPIYSYDSDY